MTRFSIVLAAVVCLLGLLLVGCAPKTSAPQPPPARVSQPPQPAAQPAPAEPGKVQVTAFYPDNEGHAPIKQTVLGLEEEYPGKVSAEFIDFTSDEGYERWKEAGMTCGGIIINGEQTCTVTRDGKEEEVTFMMGMGGEWTKEDLEQVVAAEVAKLDS
jgi:hypothetical protein